MNRMKERIVITLCAFIMLLTFSAVFPRPKEEKNISSAALEKSEHSPIFGKTICIDPGHGGADGGTRGRESLVWEREINLAVALKLKAALENAGAQVVMTREDENTFSRNKREDLEMRLALCKNADLFVSIHMNEFRDRKESGPQVFYRKGQKESRLLAGIVQERLIKALQPVRERQAMAGNYFVLSLSVPSVLVECGFLSNPEEERKLLNGSYQTAAADAVKEGIVLYFSLREKS